MRMIYIYRYNDYAAITAAYLHLKMNTEQIQVQSKLQPMKLYYVGIDEELKEIYLLKYTIKKSILMNILQGIGNIFNEDVVIQDLYVYDRIIYRMFNQWSITRMRRKMRAGVDEDYL